MPSPVMTMMKANRTVTVIPTVASRHPLWEEALGKQGARSQVNFGPALADGREAMATTALEAEPQAILRMPGDSYLPILLALALAIMFSALLVKAWVLVALAVAAIAVDLVWWLWPRLSAIPLAEAKGREVAHG